LEPSAAAFNAQAAAELGATIECRDTSAQRQPADRPELDSGADAATHRPRHPVAELLLGVGADMQAQR
jgi:hypothetical protein